MYECVMGLKDFPGAGCILADDMGLGKVCLYHLFLLDYICAMTITLTIHDNLYAMHCFTTDPSIRHANMDTAPNRPNSKQGTNRQARHSHLSLLPRQKLGQ